MIDRNIWNIFERRIYIMNFIFVRNLRHAYFELKSEIFLQQKVFFRAEKCEYISSAINGEIYFAGWVTCRLTSVR